MKIVFFDGYCNVCTGLVDWILKHDKDIDLNYPIQFASLQGKTAKQWLEPSEITEGDPDSIIYLRGKEKYKRSTAVLKIAEDIGGIWSLSKLLLLIPTPLRDVVYNLIAKNRYRLFGKRESCRVPTAAERIRLLD